MKNKKNKQQRTGWVSDYIGYLNSKWWRSKRKQRLWKAGYKCEKCGATNNLEVHHLHYRTLWREKDRDLQVLCRPCHENEHFDLIQASQHLQAIQRQG